MEMDNLKWSFSKETFSKCASEERLKMAQSLENFLKTFLPLQYGSNLEDLLAVLKLLYSLSVTVSSDQQNISLYKQIVSESVVLLDMHLENELASQTLYEIVEISLALMHESHFTDISVFIFNKSKDYLSQIFYQPWSEGKDIGKSVMHLNLIDIILKPIDQHRRNVFDNQLESTCDLILSLVSYGNDKISSFTTLNLLPKFLTSRDVKLKLLEKLWDLMANQIEDCGGQFLMKQHSIYMLLCSTIGFYLPIAYTSATDFILHKNEFWQIIQYGIINQDPAVRKQARYILKRALDFVLVHKVQVKTNYFKWDHPSDLSEWDRFFLVIETLEEKQVHLIKPMFPLVEKLFKTLNAKWALCALHRVIYHDNKFIVKMGVNHFLNLAPNADTKEFTLNSIFPVLNNTFIYQTESGGLCEISIKLRTLFQYFALVNDSDFFKRLLKCLSFVSWAPLPLYHVTQAIGNLPLITAWDQHDLVILKGFLVSTLASQSVFLRATAQSMLLRSMLNFTDTDTCKLPLIADVFSTFSKDECFKRGLADWRLSIDWLEKFILPEEALDFVTQYLNHIVSSENRDEAEIALNAHAVARMFVLLCDAKLVGEGAMKTLMQGVVSQLDGCDNRLYASQNNVDASLDLIVNFMEECNSADNMMTPIISEISVSIFSYLHNRLSSKMLLHEFETVQLYMSVLKMFSNSTLLFNIICSQIPGLLDLAIEISKNEASDSPTQKYYAAKCLEWFTSCFYCGLVYMNSFVEMRSQVESYIIDAVCYDSLNVTSIRPEGSLLTRDHQTLWGYIASGQLGAVWSTINHLLIFEESPLHTDSMSSQISRQALEAIEVGGPEILPPVMAVLKYYLYIEQDTQFIESTIRTCYTLSFEYRKTELFWVAIKEFIAMTFHREMVQRKDLKKILIQVVDDLHKHSQLVTGLFNLVISQLIRNFDSSVNNFDIISHTLALGLLFGPILRKDEKITNSTLSYIESLVDDIPANILLSSQTRSSMKVRIACISFMIDSGCPGLFEKVTNELLTQDRVKVNRKTRYFADSQLHYTRLRAAQSLIFIECVLPQHVCKELLEWACNSLIEESHQPSVRYLLEWLVSRILIRFFEFEAYFLSTAKQAASRRQGSMSSMICVLYLWVLGGAQSASSLGELARRAEIAMQAALPWCMAQHYNIRLYAQVVLLKIWNLCRDLGLGNVVEEFAPLQAGLHASLEHGNTVKNALKLQDDFYFSVFNPILHFTLETIFYEIPRLSNVSEDEWVLPSSFLCTSISTPVFNTDGSLKDCFVASWVLRSTGGSSGEVQDEQEDREACVVQRKITPWDTMFPDSYAREKRREETRDGLVVVASLVDRAPNLGGLSRTCEVLAACELVLPNLRIMEDKLFQSLSVSAEKWINISEVRPHDLKEYLTYMKRQGYTLIAAEQTSQSVPLHKLEFPKKCLLLLGNEKEGIPAELLPYLDICVEIPQHGVVRSLNVHVTGAIFIWQYFRQHYLPTLNSK